MSVRPSRRLSRTTVAAAAGAVAVTVLGGVAYAAIPSSANGVISACYVTAGAAKGDLRVIDAQAGAVCPAGTTPISWNAKGIAFRGAYSPVTAYKVNDVVTSGGSSYIAKLNNTGVAVTNTTNWAVLAVKGANGAVGPRGLTGPQGPTGPQGASGPQGPAGPTSAGSFQKMPFFSTTTANTWQDVTSTSYFLPRGGNVLARVAAESFCSGTSWCSVRVLVDGNEMLGGSGSGAAFDDADASSTWEAHAIDRYAGGLSAGNHTFTVQAQAVGGSSPFFRLDDSTFVLQTLG